MKTKQKLVILLGAAMTALMVSGCAVSSDDGAYSGPYYGDYGPYYGGGFYGDDFIVNGHRHHGSYGDHHLAGRSFGGGHSFSAARSGAGRALGGGSHGFSGGGHGGGGGHH